MKITIRPSRKEDIVAIEEMIYDWIHWKPKRAYTIAKIHKNKNHEILVAELDNQIVGVLHQIFYLDILNAGYNSHINFFLVKESHRGKGIGTRLINEAKKTAKKKDCIEMHVDTIYEKATQFYYKHGFKDDGVMLELGL
jgi:GNAT superfamily N-acetyltransferase